MAIEKPDFNNSIQFNNEFVQHIGTNVSNHVSSNLIMSEQESFHRF